MPKATRPAVLRYGFVPLAVAAALLLRSALWPVLGPDLPFLFLWPAVMCCAWYGGVGPGLLATLLSAVAGRYFLLEPSHSLAPAKLADGIGIILYLLLGFSLSWVIEAFHRARRQVEQHALELYNQREWFRVTLASIGDAVIATDPEGRIAFINEIAQCLTGWTAEQAKGQPLEKVLRIVNEQTRVPVDNPVHKVLKTGGTVGLANHTVLLGKGGAELPIDDSAAPIRSEQGSVQGVVMVFRDVTQRRRLENELHRRAEELVAADQRKNEFMAMLAHELRNPLAPILNAVPVLKRLGSAEPQILQTTEMIDRQSQLIRRLVEDLMDISRVSRGKISLRKEPVDLVEIVKQAIETGRSFIEGRRHEFTVSIFEEPIRLEADSARLSQVVVNLLVNAAKYTDEGGRISLTVEQKEGQAFLRVRDTGIGIAQDMLPHVFDLFTQSKRALGHAQGGLGIGLKLVRSLVEMHGGTVQAISEGPGRGSEFVVRLPVINVPQGPQRTWTERAKTNGSGGAPMHRHILVVDDNRDSAESLAMLLRVSGHEVQTAHDGLAALETAQSFQPEIVILDLQLPKLSGYEVAGKLRQQPGLGKALLIALSGSPEDEARPRSQQAGFDLHLVKPIDLMVLQSALLSVHRHGNQPH
jgi:PAS domain S-box-containing protein